MRCLILIRTCYIHSNADPALDLMVDLLPLNPVVTPNEDVIFSCTVPNPAGFMLVSHMMCMITCTIIIGSGIIRHCPPPPQLAV